MAEKNDDSLNFEAQALERMLNDSPAANDLSTDDLKKLKFAIMSRNEEIITEIKVILERKRKAYTFIEGQAENALQKAIDYVMNNFKRGKKIYEARAKEEEERKKEAGEYDDLLS